MSKSKKQLPSEDKQKIIKLFIENGMSIGDLAKKFKRSVSGIRNILNNERSPIIGSRRLYGQNESSKIEFHNEIWKKLPYDTLTHYEISNYGRIKSFARSTEGSLIKGKMNAGYLQLDFILTENSKIKSKLVHRLVADLYLPPPPEGADTIIHLDGNKANNRADNLKWVTKSEASHFGSQLNPEFITRRRQERTEGRKLTLGKVEMIRKILQDPNRTTRKKMIAKQFGISEMSLYRIQNGEMWGTKGTPLEYTKKKATNILTPEKVLGIKTDLATKELNQKQMAVKWNVSESVVSRIKKGHTYKNC